MRVPLSWLRDFSPVGHDAAAVATALDDIGLTVDGIDRFGEGFADIVVVEVLATRPHPKADRIQLVDVDTGSGEPLQIACGAFNFSAGDRVPLAPVGSTLPDGMEIGRRKLRGEWSNGMLCSATELSLGADGKGILILEPSLVAGTPLVEALGLEADAVFDIDVTANRPDAMSVAGVARDLAAKLRLPFDLPEPNVNTAAYRVENLASVAVESPDLCPRFTVRVLEGVPHIPSPDWMQQRLTMAGMRPLNLAVDASNYVMLELGQPTHPYDLDRLTGEGLLVRAAKPGERLTTLDGVERETGRQPEGETGDCLICDAEGTPVGVAGIMGGAGSGITDTTTRILLEGAYFLPMAIARTSKRLKLRSEASARFERGVDIEGIGRAVDRYCALVGAEVAAGVIDERAEAPKQRRTRLRINRLNQVLGSSLGAEEVAAHLDPIGFSSEVTAEHELEVSIPSWRPDAEAEIDLIEEVARHHGFSNLGATPLPGARTGGLTSRQRMRREVRSVMLGLGLSEAATSPMVGPDDHSRSGYRAAVLTATNPMVREESVLRATLLPGLLRSMAYNASHRNPEVCLFELGNVFRPGTPAEQPNLADEPDLPNESERLTALFGGAGAPQAVRAWKTLATSLRLEQADLVPIEADGFHPHRAALVRIGDREIGIVGEVHPGVLDTWEITGPVAVLDLDFEALVNGPRLSLEQQAVSRFPSSDIDLAFEVPEALLAQEVEGAIRRSAGPDLRRLELFDVYRGSQVGDGKRGLGFRLRFQADDRTLTDAEVAGYRASIVDTIQSELGATLRG